MTYRGQIRNGRIMLDEPVELPEGARVHVDLIEERKSYRRRMLKLPLEHRRTLLMRQSERLAGHYESDPDATDWQGGDIVE